MKRITVTFTLANAPDDFKDQAWTNRILQRLDDEGIFASAETHDHGAVDPSIFPDPAWVKSQKREDE